MNRKKAGLQGQQCLKRETGESGSTADPGAASPFMLSPDPLGTGKIWSLVNFYTGALKL